MITTPQPKTESELLKHIIEQAKLLYLVPDTDVTIELFGKRNQGSFGYWVVGYDSKIYDLHPSEFDILEKYFINSMEITLKELNIIYRPFKLDNAFGVCGISDPTDTTPTQPTV